MITLTLLAALASLLGSPAVTTAPTSQGTTGSVGAIKTHILKLENEWAQVDVTNDRSIFERILAPEFFFTDSRTGKRKGRAEWLADWESEGVTSATNINTSSRCSRRAWRSFRAQMRRRGVTEMAA